MQNNSQLDNTLDKIAAGLKKAQSIALFCHTNPDGDTVGSALALAHALRKSGKKADIYCDTAIPDRLKAALDGANEIEKPVKLAHDVSVAVDCSDLERLGGAYESYMSSPLRYSIDHHKSHRKMGALDAVDENAAATGQLIFKLIRKLGEMDAAEASLLYSAIVSDSGCFSYSSTTKETLSIAAELITYDFDAQEAVYKIFKRIYPSVFKLKCRVLNACRFYDGGKIAVIIFNKRDFEETGTDSSDTDGIISSVIDVEGVEAAFSIAEVAAHSYKISVRTKDAVDASDCAAVFGGGGHARAAGCRLNGFLEDIIEKLLKTARDRL